MSVNLNDLLAKIISDNKLIETTLTLQLHNLAVTVKSNSAILIAELAHYFRHVSPVLDSNSKQLSITAIQLPNIQLDLPFQHWAREAGKTGRKESIIDLTLNQVSTRVIHKVRTGMYFMQSEHHLFALGHCEQNPNQIINFINNQFLNHLQQQPSALCHASALVHHRQAIAIAGLSGGGKSTLMLHLLEASQSQFMSNDRLVVIKQNDQQVMAYGIPKLPRVNPGTLLNQASLTHILSNKRQQSLAKLPLDELWQLEEKYDVDIESWLGKQRIEHAAPLKYFIILNWSHNTAEKTQLNAVSLIERQDLLPAIMKSYGPFYQYPDGHFLPNGEALVPEHYLTHLADVEFYELSGKIDFTIAVQLVQSILLSDID